ncbi:AMP-binding protein [Microbacterium lacticum]
MVTMIDEKTSRQSRVVQETVATLIQHAVERGPDRRILYPTPGGTRATTYRDTYEEAVQILGNLQAEGVAAGDVAILALDSPDDFIPSLWASVLGGITPCPIVPRVTDADLWEANLAHLSALFDDPVFVTTAHNRKHFGDRRVVALEQLRQPISQPVAFAKPDPEEPAFFMLSSGSTGAPKAIVLSHRNILASLEGKRQATGLAADDITLNWIAFDHVAALTECHLLPLYTGSEQLHASPVDIVSDPLFFLQIISDHRVTHTFTPNFLLGQIVAQVAASGQVRELAESLDLSKLKRFISGGEANVCATGERFLDLFAAAGLRRSALWPAFGMTETCAGSIYSTLFESEIGCKEFASLGWPVTGLELRIQREDGSSVPPGQEGELQLRGEMIFTHYHANPDATAEAFTSDGWFRTGDLGLVETDTGSLQLVGRSKDSIIVNGVNYFLHELESAIGALDGVAPSFVACFPTRPKGSDTEALIVFYSPLDETLTPDQLRAIGVAIRNVTLLRWGFRPALILPVDRETLTKTSLGKIQRSALRKKYEAGDFATRIAEHEADAARFEPPLVPPTSTIEQRVVNEFSRITGISAEAIGATSNFFSLGGTSLEILQLLAAVNALASKPGRLALVDLVRDPTPRGIASLLAEDREEAGRYDPVVPLQRTGSQTPVFLLHPGVGEVLVFINFANFFTNERPVYALRARGFNPGEEFFSSFEELVSTYVDAIRSRQTHGPYLIAGYSYGGPVSLPIAQRLEALGEEVHLLVIDAPPVIEHPRGTVDRLESALMLSLFLDFIDRDQVDEHGQYLKEHPELDPAEYLFAQAPANRVRELGLSLPSFTHWNELAYGLAQIGKTHRPVGKTSDVRVFYAQPIWGDKNAYLETMLRRWGDYSDNPVRYVEVPGQHHTVLGPDFVDRFQSVFKAELTRIEEGQTL